MFVVVRDVAYAMGMLAGRGKKNARLKTFVEFFSIPLNAYGKLQYGFNIIRESAVY